MRPEVPPRIAQNQSSIPVGSGAQEPRSSRVLRKVVPGQKNLLGVTVSLIPSGFCRLLGWQLPWEQQDRGISGW